MRSSACAALPTIRPAMATDSNSFHLILLLELLLSGCALPFFDRGHTAMSHAERLTNKNNVSNLPSTIFQFKAAVHPSRARSSLFSCLFSIWHVADLIAQRPTLGLDPLVQFRSLIIWIEFIFDFKLFFESLFIASPAAHYFWPHNPIVC